MVSSNDDGIQKVIDDEGKYAYFMESASIEYIVERKCKVTQVGGLLDNKVDLCSSLNHLMSALSLYVISIILYIQIYVVAHLGIRYCHGSWNSLQKPY